MGRKRRVLGPALASLVVLALVAAAFVAVAQPQVVVGDPLPQVASLRFIQKPDPPRNLVLGNRVKLPSVDLVGTPAPVTIAPPDDPLVQALLPGLTQALIRSGDTGESGVQVIDADGRIVFDFNGTMPLIPASTAKLVTAAAALTLFGPTHTFTTTLTSTTLPSSEGVIAGDVLLTGGGDPTLVSQAYVDIEVDADRPQTPISLLADQVLAAGVTAVEGSVVGDGTYLDGGPQAVGWPPRYLTDLDATPIGGLTVDEGLELYTNDNGAIRARASADTALDAAAALTTALADRGIAVGGPPQSSPTSGAARGVQGPGIPGPVLLGTTTSPPMEELLTHMVQFSDNHIADMLFRTIGRHVDGTGTFADGQGQVEAALADLELDWSTTTLSDGSGLSRESLIPPGLLATLNYRMTNSSVGPAWQDLMAVSGVSGTLRRRLVGTIAELRLRGKTGSLGDVRSLSGAVVGPDGRPLYFTVASNALAGPQLANSRRLQDLVVLALSAQLYGCTEIEAAEPAADATEAATPAGQLPPLPQHTCG